MQKLKYIYDNFEGRLSFSALLMEGTAFQINNRKTQGMWI